MCSTSNDIIVLGEINVGKSAILERLIGKPFNANIKPTIGVSFKTVDYTANNLNLKMTLWDTSGRSIYNKVTPFYCNRASAAIIVYDISDKNSFSKINYWINFLRNNSKDMNIIFIVGNKADLRKRREFNFVTHKEASDFAFVKNMPFYETSAKTGLNIDQMFKDICSQMIAIRIPNSSQLEVLKYKIIMIGDSGVGKSCILERMTGRQFPDLIATTVATDFHVIKRLYNNMNIKIDLWDTCGQERYRAMLPTFFRGADSAILVYSIIDENTFKNLNLWLIELEKWCEPVIPVVLLGNKCDLESERQVEKNVSNYFINNNVVINRLFEVSAKCDTSMESILEYLLQELTKSKQSFNVQNSQNAIILNERHKKPKKKCC